MKRFFSLFLSCALLLGGCCHEKGLSEMEKIQAQLTEMEGYACTATLIRQTENGEKSYETKQYYKSTGEYRLELTAPAAVAGNYTVFDGERICQYNPRVNNSIIKDVPASQHRNELFLGQFIKNYLQSEGVGVETASFDSSKCIVLEAILPGNDDGLATEKLWVDRKSLLPVRFVIYNTDGEARYQMEYHDFTFHPHLEAALFQIQE
nr:hypothetical protein [uncultured Anaerotignum sp.]